MPTEPVSLVLPHARLLREFEGLVEVADRRVDLAQPEQAQTDVAVVLAHGGLGLQLLADIEGLLVVAERLAELAEQQVDATDVAERVAEPAGKVRFPVQLEHLPVLLE